MSTPKEIIPIPATLQVASELNWHWRNHLHISWLSTAPGVSVYLFPWCLLNPVVTKIHLGHLWQCALNHSTLSASMNPLLLSYGTLCLASESPKELHILDHAENSSTTWQHPGAWNIHQAARWFDPSSMANDFSSIPPELRVSSPQTCKRVIWSTVLCILCQESHSPDATSEETAPVVSQRRRFFFGSGGPIAFGMGIWPGHKTSERTR